MQALRCICLYLLISVCFVACREKIVEAPQPDPALSWQLSNNFLFDDKIQLNSYADSSLIILAGTQTTTIAPNPDGPKTDSSFIHYGGQAQPNGRADYRPLLTPSFIAFLYNDYVNIVPTASPVTAYANVGLHMNQLDTDFAGFNLLPVAVGETMAANRQNQFIIPYQRYDRSYSTPVIDGGSLSILLVSVTSPQPPNVGLATKKTQIVTLNGGLSLYSVGSVGDYFIVSTTGGTFRIAPDGSYQQTYPYGLLRQFTFNGIVYGVTKSGGPSLQLIASPDQGLTWSVLINQLPDIYEYLTFKQVNNRLIAIYNSQLFQLTLTPTTLTSVELDNTGLYGNRITSVVAFHNTVYVSTLSGVFTKPIRTFLVPKKAM